MSGTFGSLPMVSRPASARAFPLRAAVTACVFVPFVATSLFLLVPAAQADTGVLKLMVFRCQSAQTISGARVDVSVTRGGSEIASGSGYTDDTGYVAFTFTGLQNKDAAKVTITPVGEAPDGHHLYYWTSGSGQNPGLWDFNEADYLCADDWYNQGSDIIECVYQP